MISWAIICPGVPTPPEWIVERSIRAAVRVTGRELKHLPEDCQAEIRHPDGVLRVAYQDERIKIWKA